MPVWVDKKWLNCHLLVEELVMSVVQLPERPTHAVMFYDNWDGEGDTVYLFAFKVGNEFYQWECGSGMGEPILQHHGDEILGAWELTPSNCETA